MIESSADSSGEGTHSTWTFFIVLIEIEDQNYSTMGTKNFWSCNLNFIWFAFYKHSELGECEQVEMYHEIIEALYLDATPKIYWPSCVFTH